MKIKFKLTPDEIGQVQRGGTVFVPHVREAPVLLEVELDDDTDFISLDRKLGNDGFHVRKQKADNYYSDNW